MAKYAKRYLLAFLFLCSTNCMLLNTVHRGKWEYIARSVTDNIIVIVIVIIIVSVIINIIIGCYNASLFVCNHNVWECFWQEQWLSTHSQTAAAAAWRVVVLDGTCSQKEVLFSHQSTVLSGLTAVFTKIIFKHVLFTSS